MIICFDCKITTKEILDNLISAGHYKDYNEIMNLAIDNLSLLEGAMQNSGGLVIQRKEVINPQTIASETNHPVITSDIKIINPPEIFTAFDKVPTDIIIPNIPENTSFGNLKIPFTEWLFGQYNRFLPVKMSCRSIANHQIHNMGGIKLDSEPILISKEVLEYVKILKKIEKKNKLGRDELLTIALPSTEKDEEKSLLRYANQFVVYKNSNNQLQGLLFDLKLLNFTSSNNYESVSLTKYGWEFAKFPNPILEDFQDFPAEKFSEEEQIYIIDHIINNVPIEKSAYSLIISELEKGNNTPDQLDKAIEEQFAFTDETRPSQAFLSTQRSGAISRMIDLNLIERIREGIRVKYRVTEKGIKYFLV